jgi:secreted trypsin-like serine protease
MHHERRRGMAFRRSLVGASAVLLAALTALGTGGAASAMVNGSPDTAHPEAGALYFSATPNGAKHFSCSGALIDTQAFLTAAHCFTETVRKTGSLPITWVTFDQHPTASSTYYAGTVTLDPKYDKTTTHDNLYADDVDDYAVVHLAADPGIQPARLPTAGLDAALPHGQPLTVVGYGTSVTQGGGAPTYPPTGQRESARLTLQTVTINWMHESQNREHGNGGACGGDSGGPNYLSGTHIVLSTTITGDMVCRSTNVSIRLDTPNARSFLATQVSYPLP